MAVAQQQRRRELEHATLIGYQAVKCWVVTQSKKKMPAIEALLPKRDRQAGSERQTHEQMEAMMHMLAARVGATVKNPRLGKGSA